MTLGGFDIRSLAKLLDEVDPDVSRRQEHNDSDSDLDEFIPKSSALRGPGDIASFQSNKSNSNNATKTVEHKSTTSSVLQEKEKSKIWDMKETLVLKKDGSPDSFENDNISITNDPRKNPNYEMHYRQAVTTEDIFLQMGNKTPSTASCEDLIVEIHLPGDDFQKIQLNLKKQTIDLRSTIHFLYLNLPHPINPRAGSAKWDSDKDMLILTLKLCRELDDLNF